MLHAKQIMVDDWLIIGSSNFNHRSFFLDLEVDYVLSEPQCIDKIIQQFRLDKNNSEEIFTDSFDTRTWTMLFYSLLAKLFKSWI